MKKYLMVMVAAASFTTAALAQKMENHEKMEKTEKKDHANVPALVKQAFEKQYAGIKVKWDNEDGKYEAGFKHNGHKMSVLYNSNGVVEETEMDIPVSQLPSVVMSYINQHKLGKVSEAAKITKSNGVVNYEAEINGKDIIFDAAGKFLKEVKD